MKKKKMFISFMALVVLFAFTQMAMAFYTIQIDTGLYYPNNGGGEFRIDTLNSGLPWSDGQYSSFTKNQGVTPSFQTFCLETNEYFSSGGTYRAVLNTDAVAGGVGGPSPDPVSIGTADLYYQFAKGTLSGYNYGAGRTSTGAQLQEAIWVLENEIANDPTTNIFLNAIIGLNHTYPNLAAARADNNGAFPVMALNMTTPGGVVAQDQLVVVPIPAAAWLLGSGLIGLVAIRRRMKK